MGSKSKSASLPGSGKVIGFAAIHSSDLKFPILLMIKTWDLAKKSEFSLFLSTEFEYANFLLTLIIYIKNGSHDQILQKKKLAGFLT